MSEAENEILELCHILFQNLGISDSQLLDISNIEVLFDDSLYIEIFKLMFPVLKSEFESIEEAEITPSEKIQTLIDYLATEILKIDLNHIEGGEITEGNLKHVLHFVQLLAEVSNLCKLKSENDSEILSYNDEDEEEKYEFNGKVYDPPVKEGKIHEEELMLPPKSAEKALGEDFPSKSDSILNKGFEEEDVSEIKEVSKSKETSEIGKKSKGKKKSKKGISTKLKEENKNEIENIYKKIKEDLEVSKGNEIEVYENDPIEYNLMKEEKPKKKEKKPISNHKKSKKPPNQAFLHSKPRIMKNIERNIFSAKTFQPRYLTENPEKKPTIDRNLNLIKKLENVSFLQGKDTESIKKSLGLQMEAKQEVENIYEILCENIEKIKENLDGMRNYNLNDDDFQTMEKLIRQRNEYKTMLKEYIKYTKNFNSKSQTDIEERNSLWKMRNAKIYENKLQEEVCNEQKSHFYKLRDEKIKHRTIFEMEKKKILEEKKEFQEIRNLRNQETQALMASVETVYRNKKEFLREKLEEKKQERKSVLLEERRTISELQRKLKDEKANQMEILKAMWKAEKEKFDMLVENDDIMKGRIERIYKKY